MVPRQGWLCNPTFKLPVQELSSPTASVTHYNNKQDARKLSTGDMSSEEQSEGLTDDLEPPTKRPRSSRDSPDYFEVVSRVLLLAHFTVS